jgi:hypothetical protein
VAERATDAVRHRVRIPVERELHLGVLVTGRGEVDQRVAARFAARPAHLHQTELAAVEVERRVEVGDAHHRVQVFHGFSSMEA